jgi:hypothetical protein
MSNRWQVAFSRLARQFLKLTGDQFGQRRSVGRLPFSFARIFLAARREHS